MTESLAMVDAVKKGLYHEYGVRVDTIEKANVYVLGDGIFPTTAACLAMFMPLNWHYVSIDPMQRTDIVALGEAATRVHLQGVKSQDYRVETVDYYGDYTATSSTDTGDDNSDHSNCVVSSTISDHEHDTAAVTNTSGAKESFSIPTAYSPDEAAASNTTERSCEGDESACQEESHSSSAPGRNIASQSPPSRLGHCFHIVVACHSHAPLQEFWDRVPAPKLCVAMPCCGKTWSVLSVDPVLEYEDFEVLSPKRKISIYSQMY
jgi:hypothetical protein